MPLRNIGRSKNVPENIGARSEALFNSGIAVADHVHQFVEEPVALPFLTGWSTLSGTATCSIYKLGNFVKVEGLAICSVAGNQNIATVPTEFLPAASTLPFYFSCPFKIPARLGNVTVTLSSNILVLEEVPAVSDFIVLSSIAWIIK